MPKSDEALERMRGLLEQPAARNEGSFSMFNLRAVAQELALLRNEMEILENHWSLDTAVGDFLDAKAKDYGLARHGAAFAAGEMSCRGTAGAVLPPGGRFVAQGYGVVFAQMGELTIGEDGSGRAAIQAVGAGSTGNVPAGTVLVPQSAMNGFSEFRTVEATAGGYDRESDEQLRLRLYNRIRYPQTSGNVYHYRQWAQDVPGVGAVKVFPLWNGPGTVKVSILDANGAPAAAELIQSVQDAIDPEPGRGAGKAPIGALVSVTTAVPVRVDVAATVVPGAQAPGLETLQAAFVQRLGVYFRSLAYNGRAAGVSPALVGRELLEVAGVLDYTALTLNGGTAAVAIGEEQVAVLGTVVLSR